MNICIKKNIKHLSGIAAILMLAVSVIGCKHNINNKPEAFTITFSVDGTPPNGTIKATVDGSEINSGNKVEYGKTVTFTATPDAGYTVKEWKADGSAVTGSTSNTYTCTVTKALTVKVNFLAGGASYTVKHYQEKIEGGYPAEPAESENQNGTVGANAAYTAKNYTGFTYKSALTKVNNTVQTEGTINADSSTVVELYYERNTVNVTFKLASGNVSGNTADILKTGKYGTALTAPAPEREGYAFIGWSPVPPSPLAFPAINTEYTAQWKIKTYAVTFGVKDGNGMLKATADGVAETETSPIAVEHGKTVTLTAVPTAGYKVKEWKLNGNAVNGTNPSYTHTITQAVNVTVSFELGKAILTLDPSKLTVKVKAKTADGNPITVVGCNETTLASDVETTLTAKVAGTQITLQGTITELNCGLTQLTALDVSGLTALQKLDCSGNELTALNVQGLTALQEFNCNNNDQLATLNVQGLTELQELNCSRNQLTTLNVQNLTALQKLECGGNQLSTLNAQGLTKLQELNCVGNQLSTLDVQGLTALQTLSCENNQLATLNVQGCASLQKLYCNGSETHRYLSELNVQGCTALKELICYQNKLNADAFIKIFNDLPEHQTSDGATAILYVDRTAYENNCTDFTQPESLKKAFENARYVKHWKMQKMDGYIEEDI